MVVWLHEFPLPGSNKVFFIPGTFVLIVGALWIRALFQWEKEFSGSTGWAVQLTGTHKEPNSSIALEKNSPLFQNRDKAAGSTRARDWFGPGSGEAKLVTGSSLFGWQIHTMQTLAVLSLTIKALHLGAVICAWSWSFNCARRDRQELNKKKKIIHSFSSLM